LRIREITSIFGKKTKTKKRQLYQKQEVKNDSNKIRNTMMEKTTLQLIRKVEEKTANKIESRPGYLEFPYTGNRPSQSEKSSRREENINV
jgi:hypothetical protein